MLDLWILLSFNIINMGENFMDEQARQAASEQLAAVERAAERAANDERLRKADELAKLAIEEANRREQMNKEYGDW